MSDANMKVEQKGNSLTGRYVEATVKVTDEDGNKETVTVLAAIPRRQWRR